MKKNILILLSLLLTTVIRAQDPTEIDRTNWMVTTETATNYDYVLDTSTGYGAPELMFDGDPNTFLSLLKPGKGPFYNIPDVQPSDFIPSFIVDMKSPQTFNYIKWTHRLTHAGNFLRVFAVKMYGSDDGSSFAPINGGNLIWIPNKAGYVGSSSVTDDSTYTVVISQSTCRYVKVSLEMWSNIYNGQYPGSPGAGSIEGNTLQIAEFGLGKYDPRIMPVADINFGEVLVGGISDKILMASGISVGSITAAITAGEGFTITPDTQTPTDDRYPFTITFAPIERKIYNATVTLSSAGVDPVSFNLTGNADFDLPVQISSEDTFDEHWYYIQFYRKASANTVWSLSDSTAMIVQDTLKAGVIRDDQQWKICGNWTDGYYLVNKTNPNVQITYNETASTDGTRPANRYLKTGLGDLFDFVRFGTTEDWQFYNRSYAEDNPSASYKYVNDSEGKFICHYSLNDAGNRLRFIPADVPAIAASAVSLAFDLPQGETSTQSLTVSGLHLTEGITAIISGDDASAFGFGEGSSTLPATGGQLNITFSPVDVKTYTATLTLTSGEATLIVPLTGNSDLDLPVEFSTDTKEVWYYISFNRKSTLTWSVVPEESSGLRYETMIMQTTKEDDNENQHWKLMGNYTEGYRIINRLGGALQLYKPADATSTQQIYYVLTEEELFGDKHLFKSKNASGQWQLQIAGQYGTSTSYTYMNDWNGNNGDGRIGLWSAGDGGNYIIFTPVNQTGIEALSVDPNDPVVAVKYYTLMGLEVARPTATGIYIVRNIHASGKVKATKQMFIQK